MLRNLITVALRNFRNHRFHFLINLTGLSVGFLALLLIGLYVNHELDFDRYHPDAESIVRLTDPWGNEFSESTPAIVPNPWAPALAEEFPEVEAYTRVQKRLRFNPMLAAGDQRFFEDGFISADSGFFDVFGFRLAAGDPHAALRDPNSIVISARKARKYFGDKDALDQVLVIDQERTLRVTGVLEDGPPQSHLQFDFILPIDSLPRGTSVYSYFKLGKETDVAALEQKVTPFLRERFAERYPSQKYNPRFQYLTDIHLKSKLEYEFKPNGNINNLRMMMAIGILILLIALFNYINLNTALLSFRLKEVGLRRVMGGNRRQVFLQLALEGGLLCTLSFCIALAIGALVHPLFGSMLSRNLDWYSFMAMFALPGLVLAVVVGVASGAIAALLLTRTTLTEALRGTFVIGNTPNAFNKVLVAGQYLASAVLVSGVIVIHLQLEMLQSRDLGFDRSQVIAVNGRLADGLDSHAQEIKDAFGQLPEVEGVAFSQTVPGDYRNMASITYQFEGVENAKAGTKTIFASPGFVETLGIEMVSGRTFSGDYPSDSAAYIINEACAKMVGWENPVGKKMRMTIINKMEGTIIGVMKDFHFASLHSPIEPVVFTILPETYQKILIRTKPGVDIKNTLEKMSAQWTQLLGDYPFDFQFLDQKFSDLYEADRQFSSVLNIFTSCGLILTAIGLYAVVTLEVTRRTREIGIRKVVGATMINIFMELNRSPLKLMTVALLLSMPITWFALTSWLANFAYAVQVEWWLFAASMLALAMITVLSTGNKIWKAAAKSPVEALRQR